jgi:dihydroorotase
MPNLKPPVTTAAQALAYRERILAALPARAAGFTPLMTLYLTDNTRPTRSPRAGRRRGGAQALPGRRHHQQRRRRHRHPQVPTVLEAMQRRACCCWCTAR